MYLVVSWRIATDRRRLPIYLASPAISGGMPTYIQSTSLPSSRALYHGAVPASRAGRADYIQGGVARLFEKNVTEWIFGTVKWMAGHEVMADQSIPSEALASLVG